MKAKKTFLSIFIGALLICGSYFAYQYYTDLKETKRQQALLEQKKVAWQVLRQKLTNEISQFKGETGIVVKDLETGWELSYGKNQLFPSASLVKIPLMAACFLAADQGRIKLDRNIALKSVDKLTGSGVLKDMPAGTTFSVERLTGLMIYDSDNTATNIVTNLLGIDYLNRTFKTFGLKDTELSRKIADYRLRDKGIENYTTAEDMALLLEKIYRRTLGNKYVSDQCISCLLYTSPSPRDGLLSRMPSSA